MNICISYEYDTVDGRNPAPVDRSLSQAEVAIINSTILTIIVAALPGVLGVFWGHDI